MRHTVSFDEKEWKTISKAALREANRLKRPLSQAEYVRLATAEKMERKKK